MNNILNDLLDGGWIERYHVKGQRMLTRQSVAEHSWRIATIMFSINRDVSSNLILASLFHDVSERVTGDIPANVKRHNPAIEHAVNEVSTAEEVRLGIRFMLNDEERKLLSWADRYEGALHCWDEYEMGNRKIATTLLRYWDYCQSPELELADKAHEAKRRLLMTEFYQRINRMQNGL